VDVDERSSAALQEGPAPGGRAEVAGTIDGERAGDRVEARLPGRVSGRGAS
jgi:hypothetical protein